MNIWTIVGLDPVAEYKFHPTRKWRFDWAFIDEKLAVEQEGAIWIQGRHTRGSGFIKDMEKYNEAARLGWRVFKFTPQQFKKYEAQSYMAKVIRGE